MEETPEQENERLLGPYRAERDAAAHRCLSALLDGRHAEAITLLNDYQLLALTVESGETICGWFDAGVADEHIEVTFTDDGRPPAAG